MEVSTKPGVAQARIISPNRARKKSKPARQSLQATYTSFPRVS